MSATSSPIELRMKFSINLFRLLPGMVLVSMGIMTCAMSTATEPSGLTTNLYVSPHGNDANPGSMDKPFATLEKARDAARKIGGPKVVTLAAGTYRQSTTFTLDGRDSGVIFRARTGEDARITGSVMIPIDAVKAVTDPAILERLLPEVRGRVLEVNLRSAGITDFGEIGPRGFRRPYVPAPLEFIVDDEPLILAQWPKQGEPGVPIGKVLDRGPVTRSGEKPTRGGTFEFATDRPERWTKADDVWITGLFANGYADNTVKVKAFDLVKKTLTTVQPHMYGFSSGKPWNTWVALNLLEEISLPGEFMADKTTGKLYFLPPDGKEIGKSRLEVTVLNDPLVAIEGATGVVFDGVSFENSRGMGVYIERGANNRIQNATLRNLGMVAVCVGKGISPDPDYRNGFTGQPVSRALGSWHEHIYDNPAFNREAGTGHGIVNCKIYNIGAGAISLGGGDRVTLQAAANFVENCDIHHFNRWDRTYKAAVNIDGVGNIIRHCLIHDCPGSAIYLHGNDHVIEYNEIHHAMMNGDDMGAFYMGRDPSERGTVIRCNYWHDLAPANGTHCLYFDDAGGDGSRIQGNIFLRAGHADTIFLNGGSDFTIDNNIFIDNHSVLRANGKDGNMAWPTKEGWFEARLKAVHYNESPWKEHYPEVQDYLEARNTMPRRRLVKNNLLVRSQLSPGNFQATDNYSTTSDSEFLDARNGNYVMNRDAGVFKQIPGFEPIPFDQIGLKRK